MLMLDHISIHITNLDLSVAFYDRVLGALGISRSFSIPGIAAYGQMFFWLYAGKSSDTPTPERQHLAFKANDRSAVDAFYQAALATGGKDNGAPGIRSNYHPNYYAAYVIDPDGYKLEAVCHNSN
jgi:catechol 2,3-dioxygenase-like lactoylglutathione lyase family enzyme